VSWSVSSSRRVRSCLALTLRPASRVARSSSCSEPFFEGVEVAVNGFGWPCSVRLPQWPVRRAGCPRPQGAGATCPLAAQCTSAADGRRITIGRYERHLAAGRARQADPVWKADFRATRPKVERKIGHLMRRRHGGRRARVRERVKEAADFSLLAAAVNLARLPVLGGRPPRRRMGRGHRVIGARTGPHGPLPRLSNRSERQTMPLRAGLVRGLTPSAQRGERVRAVQAQHTPVQHQSPR
jgi:hypothetical protein